MKCVRCGRDNDYRARCRTNKVCEGCGQRFVFEPRQGDPITDPSFQNALDVVSEGGRLSWLDDHLYYEVARRVRKRRLFHQLTRRRQVSIDRAGFEALLGRWIVLHGQPAGRMGTRAFAHGESPPDVSGHPVERLLVSSSDALVDFLLMNGFHGDHRCAVLSATGYPTRVRDALLPQLRTAPPQTIAVVHDADADGFMLATELRQSTAWFGGVDGVTVVDAGLNPAQSRRFRGLLQPAHGPRIPESLSKRDARWLSRYRLELTAVRPRSMLGICAGIVAGVEERVEQGESASGTVFFWGEGGNGGDGDDGIG
jgi:hypothetical protein